MMPFCSSLWAPQSLSLSPISKVCFSGENEPVVASGVRASAHVSDFLIKLERSNRIFEHSMYGVFCRELSHKTRCSSMPRQTSTSTALLQDSLVYSRALWVSRNVIAWNVDVGDGSSCYLYASKIASLSIQDDVIQGYDVKIKLEENDVGLPESVLSKFPHIQGYRAFEVPNSVVVKPLLKCQLAVAAFGSDGKCSNATGLQLPGILDELFSYDGPLGAHYSIDYVSLYLWAPTAQAVSAHIYGDTSTGHPLEIVQLDEIDGVWHFQGPKYWEGCYYVYEVIVYHPSTLRIEKCYANDPYARGLSSNGHMTLFVNLDSSSLKPKGWDSLADEKPQIASFSDISIYELHIRDFSAHDETVRSDFRGGYLAFTLENSAGVSHLTKLSEAGISHIHLLPTFHFGGVDDVKENWKCVSKSICYSKRSIGTLFSQDSGDTFLGCYSFDA